MELAAGDVHLPQGIRQGLVAGDVRGQDHEIRLKGEQHLQVGLFDCAQDGGILRQAQLMLGQRVLSDADQRAAGIQPHLTQRAADSGHPLGAGVKGDGMAVIVRNGGRLRRFVRRRFRILAAAACEQGQQAQDGQQEREILFVHDRHSFCSYSANSCFSKFSKPIRSTNRPKRSPALPCSCQMCSARSRMRNTSSLV